MYKHLFGPVPSRRLGMSLGVDLIPHKICSLNCIYCECGGTTKLTLDRSEYVPVKDVLQEIGHFFEHNPDPEYITFSGAGEPTLHSRMGEVLGFLKNLRPELPVAVLTNGTLLSDPSVREELMMADVVLPSLDAATDKAFRKINRPLKDFRIADYVDGLIQFKKEFKGAVWLEVLILPGYNDDTENIMALKKAIQSIGPDRIQLNTLDRPGVIEGLRPATRETLENIAGEWDLGNMGEVEIIVPARVRHESAGYRTDTEAAILETISRRPCTLEDIRKILGIHINEINKILRSLEDAGQIETTRQERGVFYQVRKSSFTP
jgi:wyosine [tRNA(Phe)-imidazoG37] synthetase (radical SAM superfamily)